MPETPGSKLAAARVERSALERVLGVVRQLGASEDLHQTFDLAVHAASDVIDFGAAAINVTQPDGTLRIEAVAGPPETEILLGQSSPRSDWEALFAECEEWGDLRFHSHTGSQSLIDRMGTWVSDGNGASQPGEWNPHDALFAPMRDSRGELLGVLSVDMPRSGKLPDAEQRMILELFAAQVGKAISDVSARLESAARSRDAELRWELAFDRSPVAIALVDGAGHISRANDALIGLLGYTREQLQYMTWAEITHPDDIDANMVLFNELVAHKRDSYAMEKRYIRSNGEVVWTQLQVGVIRNDDGSVRSTLSVVTDITARRQAEQALAHRATHDPLTGLPNRVYLEDRLSELLAANRPTGVILAGIDRFKAINDSLGHGAGNDVIAAVAQRLSEVAPEGALVSRPGGDEFLIAVPDERDPTVLRGIAAKVMTSLTQPLRIRDRRHTVTISIGIAVSGPRHGTPDDLLSEADQALLRAKRQGRSRIAVFDPMQDKPATVEDLDLEQALRHAIEARRGVRPYFQPIVSLSDNQTVGYESLVRWRHPRRGLLEPANFLPLAEQTGLVVPLGWWMLEQSCECATNVLHSDAGGPWVGVNTSAAQLATGELSNVVRADLETAGLPPQQLHLEITETALVEAPAAAVDELAALAELGVVIALDDFGTGYSSLSLLRDLPVSVVKIDRSFVGPIAYDRRARAIVRSVISLCQELGMQTVGEGVETAEQLTALRALGCSQAQGYLIGAPKPLDRVRRTNGGTDAAYSV